MSPGCQTANFPPSGSENWPIRPWVNTSNGSALTTPPAFLTASAVAFASWVWK